MSSHDRLRIDPLALDGPSELHTRAQDGKSDQRHVEEGREGKHYPPQVGTPGSAVLPSPTQGARMVGEHDAEPGGHRKNFTSRCSGD
jgi:hypothetical protein